MTSLVSITGRVQGVGFRMWVADEARRRGLSGWVRNRRDGSVDALFSGDAEVVANMIAACRHGPPMARVANVVQSEGEPVAASAGFVMLPTL